MVRDMASGTEEEVALERLKDGGGARREMEPERRSEGERRPKQPGSHVTGSSGG